MALTPSGFGTELRGVDLARLDGPAESAIVEAFHESGGLLLVRGQGHIRPDDFMRFARLLGELELNEKYNPDFLVPDHPEVLRIGNLRDENGNGERYRSLFIRADPPPLLWHSDDTFRHPQPLGSCLLCIETPPHGGETWFAGTADAYEELPDSTKERIEGLAAVHSYDHLNEYLRRRNPHRPPLSRELREQFPPIERPIVAEHPVTHRKCLYVPKCHIESVNGLDPGEGERLVDELLTHATGPRFAYEHRWAHGDVVLWDNRCALHAPSPFDDERYRRLLYRITVNGAQIIGF
jgi:taurine dioxygenase